MATLVQILEAQLSQFEPSANNAARRIYIKEVLQAFVLSFLYNHKHYRLLNFYGGSCLRIINGLNRMSEDIDLDNAQGIDLGNLSTELNQYFKNNLGADLITTVQQFSSNKIFRVMLKFPILYDLQLSQHRDENLHLKLEISQHPQISIVQQTPVIVYGQSFVPNHFSIETLMAGKMLACLERSFRVGNTETDFKARDFYDLLWLMQKEIAPLTEKLKSDGKIAYTPASALTLLRERVKKIKVEDLKRDLAPLFENTVFINAWCETFHQNFERFSKAYLLH
jgi:predicted nucleotidyltransferase component of viral defense system